LSMGRRRSNASTAERAIARRKFWDAMDAYPDDLMLRGADRDAELVRLQAERDALASENLMLSGIKNEQQRELEGLRRAQTAPPGTDDEFEQLLRENGRLRQDYERLSKEIRFLPRCHGRRRCRSDRSRERRPLPRQDYDTFRLPADSLPRSRRTS
jgi:hypothetical protein